jgi:hypothetical protein|tara:strand:- start:418 stop:642 length:225 start_codon:yes stop_codon:yes gene_type:complete
MNDTKTEEREMVSREEIKKSFEQIVKTNRYKKGTEMFKTAECSFLQGVMVADSRQLENPYFAILIISGRSILDD